MNPDYARLIESASARTEYFAAPEHAHHMLWTALGIRNTIDFGYLEDTTDWRFADQFDGRVPLFSDASNPVGLGRTLRISAQLMIDSDVANRLARYYFGEMKDPGERAVVARFLQWFASTPDMNLNPAYNIVERVSRSGDNPESPRYAKRVLVSTMAIETMDKRHFLANEAIRSSEEGRRHLVDTFKTDDLERIADIQLSNPIGLGDDFIIEYFYLLLKVALIDAKLPRRDLLRKIETLADYVEHEFGIVAPFELAAALLQFTGQVTKFLTLVKDWTFERNVERIRHAAWDSLYMRAPQAMLQGSVPQRVHLCFPMTCDKESAMVLRASKFGFMINRPGGNPTIGWGIDYPTVLASWGNRDDVPKAIKRVERLLADRSAMQAPKPDFPSIAEDLYRELRDFLDG
jgi:hypothetical protein